MKKQIDFISTEHAIRLVVLRKTVLQSFKEGGINVSASGGWLKLIRCASTVVDSDRIPENKKIRRDNVTISDKY